MTAPVAGSRTTPGGIPLRDGHPTKIAFAADPDVSFWEKTVKPPALDGGDPIDLTTMHNTTYRTNGPRALLTLGEVSVTAEYDPNVYNNIIALINVETTVTILFADGSTLAFFGFLRTFDPQEISEGNPPLASISITPTNWDPVAHVEAGPVLTSAAGT